LMFFQNSRHTIELLVRKGVIIPFAKLSYESLQLITHNNIEFITIFQAHITMLINKHHRANYFYLRADFGSNVANPIQPMIHFSNLVVTHQTPVNITFSILILNMTLIIFSFINKSPLVS